MNPIDRNRLSQRFGSLERAGEGALIAYFPLGGELAPHELAAVYADAGVDVIEIGFPVERPHLDGKVIRDSMRHARAQGWCSERYFDAVAEIRSRQPSLLLQVFAYREVLASFTPEDFARQCSKAGADAVLMVGNDAAQQHEMDELLGPGIPNLRFAPFVEEAQSTADIERNAKAYLFLQATSGVTGARSAMHPALGARIAQLNARLPELPVCAGFGISSPEHCRQLRRLGADGAIVGSAIVERLQRGGVGAVSSAGRFMQELKRALQEPRHRHANAEQPPVVSPHHPLEKHEL